MSALCQVESVRRFHWRTGITSGSPKKKKKIHISLTVKGLTQSVQQSKEIVHTTVHRFSV